MQPPGSDLEYWKVPTGFFPSLEVWSCLAWRGSPVLVLLCVALAERWGPSVFPPSPGSSPGFESELCGIREAGCGCSGEPALSQGGIHDTLACEPSTLGTEAGGSCGRPCKRSHRASGLC